jgi:uncharacterized membrane protein (UPF0127 family)
VVAVLGAIVLVVAVGDTAPEPPPLGRIERSAAPFAGWGATDVQVGSARLRVAVADDPTERARGLRGRRDLGDYDGMLFVFGETTTAAFTMAGVPVALDVGFFAADGRRVDRLRMRPCDGTDADCPVYRSSAPYAWALETLAGRLPDGRLRVRANG